jgi:hypothetical protein
MSVILSQSPIFNPEKNLLSNTTDNSLRHEAALGQHPYVHSSSIPIYTNFPGGSNIP